MKPSINRVTATRSIELTWGYVDTAAGRALIAVCDGRVCALDLRTGKAAEQQLRDDWSAAGLHRNDSFVEAVYAEAIEHPQLLVDGTDFQLAVWRALCEIPAGETRTYGELARAIGRPGAALLAAETGQSAIYGKNRTNNRPEPRIS